ncbi:aspartate aminotransferase [Candidatus Desantisbacteria bacterium CG1_02_38_46]|uniref:Aminotransferase n=3 Tax=unclassified Candidatus Desantisiibacteriota TaxID=3106372 RepID=A0A2H9PD12_9BACT|nr:MAG: aspartate aminotransferase [Candidatus Desantisbacteria bacterium CG1_02_38_46]PIU52190.1 MAG: aspartate aminotransferase [Candidatus Desantisbacteria bacterium CG07_land_8_20_14_0_80_39_15]PIZ17316.1 MAG: aspartate aminotransferase [Candidatus Desantisbacteria bacterium CG_4_10_14_0_8_um_filter_39_17]
MKLARRTTLINPSPTLAVTAKEKQMKAQGIDVIGFGAGEPDFDTPIYIKDAAKKSIDEGFTKYTATSGIEELKKAICQKFKQDNALDYEPSQIIVSCGAKHSLFNAIMCLCEKGDEVILPSPYWVSYLEQIKLSQAKPVIIETSEKYNFKLPYRTFKHAITPKTKCLILNSPSNPTGMVYTRDELKAIADLAVKHGFYIISDEVYEKLIYEGEHISIASFGPEIKNLAIVINGVSKAYSMTGWRIGYAAGPKELIAAMGNLQDHSTSNPTSIAQKAALAAISELGLSRPAFAAGTPPTEGGRMGLSPMSLMVNEFRNRRDYIVEKLNSIPGISCLKPQGAFYAFPNISKLIGKTIKGQKITGSLSLSEVLLNEAKVTVIPGIAFGADKYIRLSYATSMENIKEGLRRIEEVLKQ